VSGGIQGPKSGSALLPARGSGTGMKAPRPGVEREEIC
jgi:hypothetical protein